MRIKHLFGFWVVSVALVSVAQAAAPDDKKKPKDDQLLYKEIYEFIKPILSHNFSKHDNLISADYKLQKIIDRNYKKEVEKFEKFDAVSYKKTETPFTVEHVLVKVCLGNATYKFKEFYSIGDRVFNIDRPNDKNHTETDELK